MNQKKKQESTIVKAAKAIGKAAGKVAALAGAHPEEHHPAGAVKKGKLPKKNKHRLPRREKKAQKRLAASDAASRKAD